MREEINRPFRSGDLAQGPRAAADEPFDVQSLLRPGAIHMLAQPIVALADGGVVAYELLARPTFPTDVNPEQWLARATDLGLRTELELACLEAACNRGSPPEDVRVFVNVSPSTVLDFRMDGVISRLPPHVIEITEHEPVTDYQALRLRLQTWSRERTLLAIDDVGSGYASMSHVLHLRPQIHQDRP